MIAGWSRLGCAEVSVGLRLADADDRARLLAWNNDPAVRARSLDPRPIDEVGHARWFAARLADPLSRVWIIELERRPVGSVRLARQRPGGLARISIVVDPAQRGRGVGTSAIRAVCRTDRGTIVAEILAHNQPSIDCFRRAGFEPIGAAIDELLDPPADGVRRFVWRPAHV